MLRIVPNLMIYMHPYDKLIKAEVNERSADVRITGSSAITWLWNMETIALWFRKVSITQTRTERDTDERSRAETRFNVFHSRNNESMNASQEFLNLINAGETLVVVHSSGKGRAW